LAKRLRANVGPVVDTIELGPAEPSNGNEISYAVGPSQLERIVALVAVPAALGLTSLVVAMASLMVVDPASEIGDVDLFTRLTNGSGNLVELRWSSGLRSLSALIALVLAVMAARLLVGRRARVRIGAAAPEADDPASLDALEAAAVAALPVPSPGQATIVGAAMLVSLLSVAFNLAAFGYAMASHIPHTQVQSPLGF
jgi:hypothetical protein